MAMDVGIEEFDGCRLLLLDIEGPALARVQDVLDLIAEALARRAHLIVVPVARLDPEFFRLHSGLAGEFAQKIVNYRLKLAVLGEIPEFARESKAFSDFVRESNRGSSIFFLQDREALASRLRALGRDRQREA